MNLEDVRAERQKLWDELMALGGRCVELAEEIDALDLRIEELEYAMVDRVGEQTRRGSGKTEKPPRVND